MRSSISVSSILDDHRDNHLAPGDDYENASGAHDQSDISSIADTCTSEGEDDFEHSEYSREESEEKPAPSLAVSVAEEGRGLIVHGYEMSVHALNIPHSGVLTCSCCLILISKTLLISRSYSSFNRRVKYA